MKFFPAPQFQFRAGWLGLCLLTTAASAQVLPPPPASALGSNRLDSVARLFVRNYRFESNTVFSSAELELVTAPFAGRQISSGELEEARRAVTLHYINHGYLNSGAVIPDQNPTNGFVTLRIIEGRLAQLSVQGNRWLRDGFITRRLQRWDGPPLNVNELKDGLQQLRQNPNVSQINAELKPGANPGEGVLDVKVVDQQPFRVGLEVDNRRPPSVGAEELSLVASDLNLTGIGDALNINYGIANSGEGDFGLSGFDNFEGSYILPVTRYETTLGFTGSKLNTSIVEEPFADLAIDSETISYGVFVRQPFFQTANREAAVTVAFERRQNETTLLDEPFNVSPGAVDGEMVVSVLRISQEWISRSQNQVLALRSTFNIGLDVLDATDDGTRRDAQFLTWLGQGQYIRRLFDTQNQLILRVMGQWTDDRLLALEQISVGGAETVRGYRENSMVRDRGLVSSAELRIPVLFNKAGAGTIFLAPFFDYGGAWDIGKSPNPTSLYSTGLGLLLAPGKHFNAQLYWGYQLQEVDTPDDEDAQDLGLHFRIRFDLF